MKERRKRGVYQGPFKHEDGEIIAREVGDPYEFDLYDRAGLDPAKYDRGIFKFQKHEVELRDGATIKVDKVMAFKPHGGVWISDLADRYMFNCHGNVFLDGKYWLNDPDFDQLLKNDNPFFEEVSLEDADFVVLWFGGEMVLSAWVYMDDGGNYIYEDKAEHGDIVEYDAEAFHRERVRRGIIFRSKRYLELL